MDLWGEIGTAAGIIYTSLSGVKKPKSITELKKKTKLKDDILYMAIGWLAREEKIRIESKKKKTLIGLIN
jgi:hypothetical protein